MNDELQIQMTADGSHTLMNKSMNESYHAHNGAMSEALHVYIKAGFEAVLPQFEQINILEFGFGTGLNALLTLQRTAHIDKPVHYQSIEPQPLPTHITSELNYDQLIVSNRPDDFVRMHQCSWDQPIAISPNFTLVKIHSTLEQVIIGADSQASFTQANIEVGSIQLIYFDAFAPKHQPEVWSLPNYQKCYDFLVSGGLLVSYCANGQFKRDLKSIGFRVEAYPGALGRREMTRAWKP